MTILGSPEEEAIPVGYAYFELPSAYKPVPFPLVVPPVVMWKEIVVPKEEVSPVALVAAEAKVDWGKYIPLAILGVILLS